MTVILLACGLWFGSGQTFGAEPEHSAAQLRARFTELSQQLPNQQFQRDLHLISAESSHALKGEIYAVINHPFATVNLALNSPANWCNVLMLHVYINFCHGSNNKTGPLLTVYLNNKYDQPLQDAYHVEFAYREVIATADYFAVELSAENGPVNTHDYRILIEAAQTDDGRTLLHFRYTYGFGLIGRIAMQGYLATFGRDKVGFTVTDTLPDGLPVYIKGGRGVVERNTMRYYLAIDAYLAALTAPPEVQLETRLRHWYNGTVEYARQLHELELDEYLEMKRREYRQVAQ